MCARGNVSAFDYLSFYAYVHVYMVYWSVCKTGARVFIQIHTHEHDMYLCICIYRYIYICMYIYILYFYYTYTFFSMLRAAAQEGYCSSEAEAGLTAVERALQRPSNSKGGILLAILFWGFLHEPGSKLLKGGLSRDYTWALLKCY